MGYSYAPSAARVQSGADRATLVRRTYGVVFLGVIVSMFGTAFAIRQPGLINAVQQYYFLAALCPFIPLWMVMRRPRDFPRNLALTLLFTFAEGIVLAPLLLLYEQRQPGVIGEAAVLTLGTFGVLSLYAVVSRRDFSAWGGFFTVGLFVLIATMVLNFFFQSPLVSLAISGFVLVIFGGLLVFDTWRLLRSGQYGPDDYVAAAVSIYLDLLNIFLAILSLLGGGNRRR